jgi:uncharacterized protein YuzE
VEKATPEWEMTIMTPPRFNLSVTTDEKTGKLLAVYLRVRDGKVDETIEIEEDRTFADYDAEGQLLGVELLAPCSMKVLDTLAQKEPEEVRLFLHSSPPRAMVLS